MDRPTTSCTQGAAKEAGRWERARSAGKLARSGQLPALLQPASPPSQELQALRAWLVGSTALRPEHARRLLEQALDRGQLVDEPALHWRAVKARIAGDSNWAQMGFRLLLD